HARLGEQPEHAGDVDDMPGAAGLQVGQEGLAAMHHAPEVDVHDPVVIIQRVAFDGSSHRHPGVVDDQIHPAVVDHYLVGPLPHGLEIGHIDTLVADLYLEAANQFQGFGQSLLVHVAQGQLTAL